MLLYRCDSVDLKCTQLSLTFEYFNIPFGQLVYLSAHFPKNHISGKICIKLGNFYGGLDIFLNRSLIGERSSIWEQKVISQTHIDPYCYFRIRGYFTRWWDTILYYWEIHTKT